ncbi:MAG: HpcH/HpaI aldolase/citrate lyase family protein [Oscillospiraceae bacterium]
MIRSMLFLPGNTPNMLINGDALGADAVILDLEDAVSPQEKDAARILVRNALSLMGFGARPLCGGQRPDSGLCQQDLEEIVPQGPTALMLPKTASAQQIQQLDAAVSQLEQAHGMPLGQVRFIPLLETALGVENAFSIAAASERILGLFLGGEDLTADLRCKRTKEGKRLTTPRQRVVCAARPAVWRPLTPLHRRKRRPGPLGRRAGAMPRAWALRERPASLPPCHRDQRRLLPHSSRNCLCPGGSGCHCRCQAAGPGRHFPPRKNDRRTHCHKGPADPVCRPNSGTDWR